jgi:hypothetical protein
MAKSAGTHSHFGASLLVLPLVITLTLLSKRRSGRLFISAMTKIVRFSTFNF